MKIEIWSDFACPFCYIGKKRFEEALNEFPHKDSVEVEYKSFLLNPDAPKTTNLNGVEKLAKSKGIPVEQAKMMYDNVVKMAATVGLNYNLDIMQATSTNSAHQLLQWAKEQNNESLLVELLYEGYFIKGLNLADFDTLVDLAEKAGLDPFKARDVLELGNYEQQVLKDLDDARRIGIASVPTFVLDREFGISGAQRKENFLNVLNQAYESNASKIKIINDGSACGPDGCDI